MVAPEIAIPAIVLPIVTGVIYAFASIGPSVHRQMTRENSKSWGKGSAKAFWREFAKHKWVREPQWPDSWFDPKTDSQIHAGIFRFDGKGMCLGFWGYWSVVRKLRKMRLERTATATVEW